MSKRRVIYFFVKTNHPGALFYNQMADELKLPRIKSKYGTIYANKGVNVSSRSSLAKALEKEISGI